MEKFIILSRNRWIDPLLLKKLCKAGLIVFILFSIFFSSLATAYHSAVSFFKKQPNIYMEKALSSIYSIPGYSLVLDYTGLSTGYGFFSPNVSSDFIVTHNVYCRKENKLLVSNAMFKTREGALRFTHINSLFMQKLDAMEDSTKVDSAKLKYLDLILKRMNERQIHLNEADSAKTHLYLYHFPLLNEFPNTNAKIFKIKTYSKDL